MVWERTYHITVRKRDDETYVATEHRTTPDGEGDSPHAAMEDYIQKCREKAEGVEA